MLFRSELQRKCMIERPNMVEPFFNVEQGLKIGPLTVYVMLEIRSLIGLIFHAKTRVKHGFKASSIWSMKTRLSPS